MPTAVVPACSSFTLHNCEVVIILPNAAGPEGILRQIMPPPDLCRVANLEAGSAAVFTAFGTRRAA